MILGLFFTFIFAGLLLVQTSFLPHVAVFGFVPNLVLVSFATLSFSSSFRRKYGLFVAVSAGLLLDFVSGRFFGMWVLIFLILLGVFEALFNRYVRTPALS